MKNTKSIGDVATAQVLAALTRMGKVVLLPFGDNERYDLVIDAGDRFVRVQCKAGRLRNGAVVFNACSSYAHRKRGVRDYRGQAELFGVYCSETRKVYFVPVEDAGRAECSLRVTPAINGQKRRTRNAADYEVPT